MEWKYSLPVDVFDLPFFSSFLSLKPSQIPSFLTTFLKKSKCKKNKILIFTSMNIMKPFWWSIIVKKEQKQTTVTEISVLNVLKIVTLVISSETPLWTKNASRFWDLGLKCDQCSSITGIMFVNSQITRFLSFTLFLLLLQSVMFLHPCLAWHFTQQHFDLSKAHSTARHWSALQKMFPSPTRKIFSMHCLDQPSIEDGDSSLHQN